MSSARRERIKKTEYLQTWIEVIGTMVLPFRNSESKLNLRELGKFSFPLGRRVPKASSPAVNMKRILLQEHSWQSRWENIHYTCRARNMSGIRDKRDYTCRARNMSGIRDKRENISSFALHSSFNFYKKRERSSILRGWNLWLGHKLQN